MNPGQMKKIMQQMGIKNTDVPAKRVVIEKDDGTKLVVENPSVTMIEMSGQKTFQVNGDISEEASGASGEVEKSEQSDADIIMEKTNCSKEEAEAALKEANGDMVEAIMLVEAKHQNG